jgi:hypothetical protein
LSKGNFKEKEKSVTGPRWAPDTKTDWPTYCRSQINFNFNFKPKNCIRLSIFCTSTIILQNYVDNKQKLYEFMKIQMSAILGKAKPDSENIRGLNLAAAKRTTVQASRLLL